MYWVRSDNSFWELIISLQDVDKFMELRLSGFDGTITCWAILLALGLKFVFK